MLTKAEMAACQSMTTDYNANKVRFSWDISEPIIWATQIPFKKIFLKKCHSVEIGI